MLIIFLKLNKANSQLASILEISWLVKHKKSILTSFKVIKVINLNLKGKIKVKNQSFLNQSRFKLILQICKIIHDESRPPKSNKGKYSKVNETFHFN